MHRGEFRWGLHCHNAWGTYRAHGCETAACLSVLRTRHGCAVQRSVAQEAGPRFGSSRGLGFCRRLAVVELHCLRTVPSPSPLRLQLYLCCTAGWRVRPSVGTYPLSRWYACALNSRLPPDRSGGQGLENRLFAARVVRGGARTTAKAVRTTCMCPPQDRGYTFIGPERGAVRQSSCRVGLVCQNHKNGHSRHLPSSSRQLAAARSVFQEWKPSPSYTMRGLSGYRFLALMGYGYDAFHRLRIRINLISQDQDQIITSPSRIITRNIFIFGYYYRTRIHWLIFDR